MKRSIRTAVLTISDTRRKENDLSGRLIHELLQGADFAICDYVLVRDEKKSIKKRLIHAADVLKVDLILTSGGTGLGPRDVTPEATKEVIEKEIPGIAELLRREGIKKTKMAALSRATAGVRRRTLIINLPGSPKGARESLEAVLELIPHAMEMIKGKGH